MDLQTESQGLGEDLCHEIDADRPDIRLRVLAGASLMTGQ